MSSVANTLMAADLVPDQLFCQAGKSTSRTESYGYLFEPTAAGCLPFGLQDVLFERQSADMVWAAHRGGTHERRAAVAGGGMMASDMLAQVSRSLGKKLDGRSLALVRQIIVCHDTIDEAIAGSLAAAAHTALDAPNAIPFALSQLHNCSVFLAFDWSTALAKAEGCLSVVAAADKWIFPFARSFGDHLCQGDASAAVVVTAQGIGGWRIGSTTIRLSDKNYQAYPQPGSAADIAFNDLDFAADVAATIKACLAQAGLLSADVELVVPQGFSTQFISAVHNHAGLVDHPIFAPEDIFGHLSNADTIIRMARAIRADGFGVGRMLFWGAGANGESAALILSRNAKTSPATYLEASL